ncbi:hypothetical protein [Flavobacterium sp.]|uniref:hypothetical protein n=1 Tax=Flavobacterium sp. TaxID=239 RepID=UPI003D2AFAEB
MRLQKTLLLLITTLIVSCGSVMKVTDLNKNGYFNASKESETLKSIAFDLDSNKTLLVVPNGVYMKGMAEKINFFERVITFDDLEKEIIRANKQDEVGSLSGNIGINNAYRKYKNFLFLRFDANKEKSNRLQLKLINPENFEEIFVGDTYYDTVWVGAFDGNTFNPLFNELIKYIKSNSNTYN